MAREHASRAPAPPVTKTAAPPRLQAAYSRLPAPQQGPLAAAPPVMRLQAPARAPDGGSPLPAGLQEAAQTSFGQAFPAVRLYPNSPAAAGLGALGFARGNQIHLAPGRYQPDTRAGRELLGHELAHVVQQQQGRVTANLQAKGLPVNTEVALEREATAAGERFAATLPVQPALLGDRAAGASHPGVIQGHFAVKIVTGAFDAEEDSEADITATETKLFPEDEITDLHPTTITTTSMDEDEVGSSSTVNHPAIHESEPVVKKVFIADRPPGLLKGKEGSHLTAWAVFTDEVRTNILGATAGRALDRMLALVHDLNRLPGLELVSQLPEGAALAFNAARLDLHRVVEAVNDAQENDKVGLYPLLLQEFVRAYLAFRNVVPFTQVDDGRAVGHGEPKPLNALRLLNDDVAAGKALSKEEAEQVRTLMWQLLDVKAVGALSTGSDVTKAPGIGGESTLARLTIIVIQHLFSLQNAYESAFQAAAVDSEANITQSLLDIGATSEEAEKIAKGVKEHQAKAPERRTDDNTDRLLASGSAGQGQYAVEVILNKEARVQGLLVGGRPHGLFGSAHGSHTTAFVSFTDVVRTAIRGQTLPDAMVRMYDLMVAVGKLPGVARYEYLSTKQKGIVAEAAAQLNKFTIAPKDVGSIPQYEWLDTLQEMIGAYLLFRNAVPLSASLRGALADGDAEAWKRAQILYLEHGPFSWPFDDKAPPDSLDTIRAALWGLLDAEAVASLGDASAPEDQPGVRWHEGKQLDGPQAIVDTIAQHLITMRAAYPVAYEQTQLGHPESVDAFLRETLERKDHKALSKMILERIA